METATYSIYNFSSNNNYTGFTTYPMDNKTILETTTQSAIFKFNKNYEKVHGYVALCVCLFGMFTNILNIIVLMQRQMRTPTNYILTALATADFLTMLCYMPYTIYLYIVTSPNEEYGHEAAAIWFVLIFNNSFIMCHSISNWLTVSLAVFRYIAVCHHTRSPTMCTLERAKLTILVVSVSSIILMTPTYFCYHATQTAETNYNWMSYAEMCTFREGIIANIIFWFYGIVVKIACSILLFTLSGLLIRAMQRANKKRQQLLNQGRHEESERTNEHNRTTAMLVAVVLAFVVTQAPQGVLNLIAGTDQYFFNNIYIYLGDIMDLLTLTNSAVNFLMYCIMSKLFRDTFKRLFISDCIPRLWRFLTNNNSSQSATNNNGSLYHSVVSNQTVV